jgi:hypothetical protein
MQVSLFGHVPLSLHIVVCPCWVQLPAGTHATVVAWFVVGSAVTQQSLPALPEAVQVAALSHATASCPPPLHEEAVVQA